jgi:hypothetical protein
MHSLPVDMMLLQAALEDHGETNYYLDRQTGEVHLHFEDNDDDDFEAKLEAEPDRYLLIESLESIDDFRTMEAFVAGLPDSEAQRDLARVLRRARPFHNFREALRDWPEVRQQWFEEHNRRLEAAARDWLAVHDIEAIPRRQQ